MKARGWFSLICPARFVQEGFRNYLHCGPIDRCPRSDSFSATAEVRWTGNFYDSLTIALVKNSSLATLGVDKKVFVKPVESLEPASQYTSAPSREKEIEIWTMDKASLLLSP